MSDLPLNFMDRPEDFLGESGSSYLQSPRQQKRISWGVPENNNVNDEKPKLTEADILPLKEDNIILSGSFHSHGSDDDHTASTADESQLLASPVSDKEVITIQRFDARKMAERPETWLGGEGDPAQTSAYLQCPKTKLRTSWLASRKEESQSLRDLTGGIANDHGGIESLHASESALFSVYSPRLESSPLVRQRLSELKAKNEENHHKNEELVVHHREHVVKEQKVNGADDNKGMDEHVKEKSMIASSHHEVVKMQRDDSLHLVQRPDSWLGGEGESPELAYLSRPKTKLRSSWLKTGSQSLSQLDVSFHEESNDVPQLGLFSDKEESNIPSSLPEEPKVTEESGENNLRNKGLSGNAKGFHTSRLGIEQTFTNRLSVSFHGEEVQMQRRDHNRMALRPNDFLGGSEHMLRARTPKSKPRASWLHA